MDDDQADSARQAERSGGRLTTTIPRPTRVRTPQAKQGRFAGLRRRRDRSDRISSTRRSAWLFGLAALVISGAIAAALFGLPVRTWFDQNEQISALERELGELESVNRDLGREVERLQTPDGIREAAREELGLIDMNDNRFTLTDLPDLPRAFPTGWPYSQLNQIIDLRAGELLAIANPELAPTTVPEPSPGVGGFQPVEVVPTAPAPTEPLPPAVEVTVAGATVGPAPTTVPGEAATPAGAG